MANRQRAEARRKAQAKAARRGRTLDGVDGGEGGAGFTINIWVIIVIVLALVVGGVIWVASSGGDDGNGNDGTGVDIGEFPDSQPVVLAGDSLPTFDPNRTGNVAPVGELPDEAFGMVAPVLSGLNFQGDAVSADPADGPYMLVFLAHWCPHCNAEVPRLLDWKAQGGVPAELRVIGVATAAASTGANYPPAQWFSNKGWSWPVIVDEAIGDGEAGIAAVSFGLSGYPYFVIVGADGLVKARVSGEIEVNELQTIVDQALAS